MAKIATNLGKLKKKATVLLKTCYKKEIRWPLATPSNLKMNLNNQNPTIFSARKDKKLPQQPK